MRGERAVKTSQEFFERVKKDNAFAEAVNDEIKKKVSDDKSSDADFVYSTISQIAQEQGYDVKAEEIAEVRNEALSELSEDELAKVAGGTLPIPLIVTTVLSCITAGSLATTFSVMITQEIVE